MEGIRHASAMGGGIGERLDELKLLDDRARPSVSDDDRQCIFMLRTHVNEMNVQSVDLGNEIRQGIQPRLARAPVIFRPPIARDLLERRKLKSLRCIRDRFLFRPLGGVDALAQIIKLRVRKLHLKWPNDSFVATQLFGSGIHGLTPLCSKKGEPRSARKNGCRCGELRWLRNQTSITTDGGFRRDCTKVLVDTLVSVGETSGSTKSESECLDARIEKLNLEEPIVDGAGLPYQLVQPRLDCRAVALLIHVRAVRGARWLPIDQDAKTHGGSRCRPASGQDEDRVHGTDMRSARRLHAARQHGPAWPTSPRAPSD